MIQSRTGILRGGSRRNTSLSSSWRSARRSLEHTKENESIRKPRHKPQREGFENFPPERIISFPLGVPLFLWKGSNRLYCSVFRNMIAVTKAFRTWIKTSVYSIDNILGQHHESVYSEVKSWWKPVRVCKCSSRTTQPVAVVASVRNNRYFNLKILPGIQQSANENKTWVGHTDGWKKLGS